MCAERSAKQGEPRPPDETVQTSSREADLRPDLAAPDESLHHRFEETAALTAALFNLEHSFSLQEEENSRLRATLALMTKELAQECAARTQVEVALEARVAGLLEERDAARRDHVRAQALHEHTAAAARYSSERMVEKLRSACEAGRAHYGVLTEILASPLWRLMGWLVRPTSHVRPDGAAYYPDIDLDHPYSVIASSGLFEQDWYRCQYSSDISEDEDPIIHYLTKGAAAGLNPSIYFDTVAYLVANPDVRRSPMNPLVHYVQHGREEGRSAVGVSSDETAGSESA